MTLTIDFTPAEERQLADAARQEGLDPASLVKEFVRRQLPLAIPEMHDPMPAEVAEENRHWDELKMNIDSERDRAGARRVF